MALSDAAPYAVAHWSMDEASGNRVDSINGYTLTDVNTVASATGMFGNAADFEFSNSEYMNIADNADLRPGDIDFTWRLWIKLESKTNTTPIVTKRSSGGADRSYNLRYNASTDRFNLFVSDTGASVTTSVDANNLGSPSTGTWYLIHAWHSATDNVIGIAVNAGTANTAAHSTGVYASTADLYVGHDINASAYADGLMDDLVFLRGYVLDATERTEDYNSGTGVAFADWAGGAAFDPANGFPYDQLLIPYFRRTDVVAI